MNRRLVLGCLLLTLSASEASAQGFISGFLGNTFSAPPLEACSITSGCEGGRRTWGVAMGRLGSVFGFEFDIGHTKAFFGETSEAASSGLLTMMGNLMVGPTIGPVQPYALAGVGVMRLNVDSLTSTFMQNDESKLAWDMGGGLIVSLGSHVGVRGDIRHFRGMRDLQVLAFAIEGSNIRFNRASASIVLKF